MPDLFDSAAPGTSEALAEKHAHAKDKHLVFLPEEHKYVVDDSGALHEISKSVTGFIAQYSETFDADMAIAKMMRGRNWPRPEYMIEDHEGHRRAMTEDEIKAQWEFNGKEAANRGTYMHHLCEWLLADERTSLYIAELRNFLDFIEHTLKPLGVTTYRLEWRLFDLELDLAGSVDYVGKLPDGTFMLADWKRSKEIKEKGFAGKMMQNPFTMLPDSNFGHYILQLNLYKLLLLRQYRDAVCNVSKMLIACFHPDCNKVYEVEDLKLGVVDGRILPYSQEADPLQHV